MEKSYLCAEQIDQMRGSYDAFVCVKITHDAGVDVIKNPSDFYCYDFGDNSSVFWRCLNRIFEDVEELGESINAHEEQVTNFRIPLPELKQFFPLLKNEERRRYINKFNAMLSIIDDYFCEFEMAGTVNRDNIQITLTGYYGIYSTFLKQLVAVRNEVRELIRAKRAELVNGMRSVVLIKMVQERLGIVVEASLGEHVNVVFSRIMERCSDICISLDSGDSFSFDAMIEMLTSTINQVVINTNREDVAA